MNKLIGVSCANFYYWVPRDNWILEQLDIIEIIKKYASRVELHLGIEDILGWNDEWTLRYKEKLADCQVSLHFPAFADKPEKFESILDKIKEVMQALGIEYAVWHADEYAKFLAKANGLIPDFKFGIENSDIRKDGFQHLKDIKILGDYPVVVDIDHLEEMQSGCLEEELGSLKNEIIAIHFSTPTSGHFVDKKEIKTTHYPFARSGNTAPENLPMNVPIVIEGVIPKGEEDLLAEEIRIIEERYFSRSETNSKIT